MGGADATDPDQAGLGRRRANYAPLTPLSFLTWARRCIRIVSGVHGDRRFTWRRPMSGAGGWPRHSHRLASRDTVAVMLANTPEMFEAHFGVPMAGAVLNTLNTRLDADRWRSCCAWRGKVLIIDRDFSALMAEGARAAGDSPIVIDVDDSAYDGPGERIGDMEYESLLAGADPSSSGSGRRTNGTPSRSPTLPAPLGIRRASSPHRGAYLNAIGNILLLGHAHILRSICGRCRCFIAMAGALRGRWPRRAARTCFAEGRRRTDLGPDRPASRHAFRRRADRARLILWTRPPELHQASPPHLGH